ncbi:MAG: SDR family oxidoreductase [Sphingobium sp.]|nr:SDR family oxidoreductase [Sphingobium sp.]
MRGTGLRVNVLSPGPTLTELAEEVVGRDAMIEMGATTPIGHVGEPSEVAAVAAFLASPDSSFMTGSEVFADGGLAQI